MIEHHIQKEIINQLMSHACLRFSELKPAGMESNIFMYHLKQLISAGYVAKCDEGYRLARIGLQYADGLSSTSLKPRKQPKLIAILALQGNDGRWLLAERLSQPYIGQRMFLSGKQHFGETMAQQAGRELLDKVGVSTPLEFRGMAEIAIHEDGELLTQVVAHVHYGTLDIEAEPPSINRFKFVWHDFTSDEQPLMAGTAELYQALQQTDQPPFMLELSV